MIRKNILIVDDDVGFANQVSKVLEGVYHTDVCNGISEFRKCFGVGRFHLVIMDMRLEKGHEGIHLLREIIQMDPLQPVIIVTAYADTETYLQALEAGALTYLDKKEFTPTLIARMVEGLLQQGQLQERLLVLEQEMSLVDPVELIGASAGITKVRRKVQAAVEDEAALVLMSGERGTGRKLVARNLHQMSRLSRGGPFVTARIPLGSDEKQIGYLFGEEDSTGNVHRGRFDEARSGTLYIEEIQQLGASAQAYLEKALISGEYTRKGGKQKIPIGARVTFSVSEPLDEMISSGRLRETLYRTISRIEIQVPPLRLRSMDIPLLAQYFLVQMSRQGNTTARGFTGEAVERLQLHRWPGNVEELRVTIEYAGLQSAISKSASITLNDLPYELAGMHKSDSMEETRMDYKFHTARAELQLVNHARQSLNMDKKATIANRLGYNDRYTFARRIKRAFGAFPELREEFPELAMQFP